MSSRLGNWKLWQSSVSNNFSKELNTYFCLKHAIETSNNNMALVEKSNNNMVIDTSNIANLNNGNNVSNIANNPTEKYELRWKGFEGNLIRYKS